jgi:hypothetical protein
VSSPVAVASPVTNTTNSNMKPANSSANSNMKPANANANKK